MNQETTSEVPPQTTIEESKSSTENDLTLTENELLLSNLEKSQFDNDLIFALPMTKLTQFLQWI